MNFQIKSISNKETHIGIGLITLLLFWFAKDTGVFWDNVIFVGKMGNHLYENGLFSWDFPNRFDPGHPPFLAFILTIGWHMLGKSLLVSHLVLAPVIFGLLLQLYKLCEHYFDNTNHRLLAFLLIIAEPTLCSHLVIINPEILILFFFFLALNSLLKNNDFLKIVALAFLGITSLRGMLLCGGFFLLELVLLQLDNKLFSKETIKKLAFQYLIASIPSLLFIAGRLYFKGWVSSHPEFPWLEFRQVVNFKEFLRNIAVLTHRYLDFGKVSIFIFLLISIIKLKPFINRKNKELLAITIIPTLTIIITSLREVNPMGHRYFMISFIGFILLSTSVLFLQNWKKNTIIYSILLVSLISGNLWVYPKDIAQGWDASLAHIPYYNLRREAIEYLDSQNISIDNVSTFSPNATTIDNVDLNGDKRNIQPFNKSQYVLYSNVYNLSDNEITSIDTDYKLIKQFKNYRIIVQILKRK